MDFCRPSMQAFVHPLRQAARREFRLGGHRCEMGSSWHRRRSFCIVASLIFVAEAGSGSRDDHDHVHEDAATHAHAVSKVHAGHAAELHEHTHAQCGIAAYVARHGWLDHDHRARTGHKHHGYHSGSCDVDMFTNCGGDFDQVKSQCPSSCPYLAPSATHTCVFSCISATHGDHCADVSPQLAFANPGTHHCEVCDVFACKVCDRKDRCVECHHGFSLAEAGSHCNLIIDEVTNMSAILLGVILAVVFLLIFAAFYGGCKQRRPNALEAIKALRLGRRHRHLCKLHKLPEDDATMPSEWNHSLFTNVHKKFICGVGLALFYNAYLFHMLVASVCLLGTWYVKSRSDFLQDLENFDIDETNRSDLSTCPTAFDRDFRQDMAKYSYDMFLMLSCVYALVFLGSVVYAWFQKQHAAWFNSCNSTMSDYALSVQGVPVDEVDEVLLAEKCSKIFQAVAPDIEVVGVSVGYDYVDRWGVVDDMVSRMLTRADIDAGAYPRDVLVTETITPAASGARSVERDLPLLADQEDKDKAVVRSWFQGSKEERMNGSGSLFCVFRLKEHKRALLRMLLSHGKVFDWPTEGGQTVQVNVQPVYAEPPSVLWMHLGVTGFEFYRRLLMSAFKVILMVSVYGLVQFGFIGHMLMKPYGSVGASAQGWVMTAAGVVLGQCNGILGGQIWGASFTLGFHRKDKMDEFIFFACSSLYIINTAYSAYSMLFMIAEPTGVTREEFFEGSSITSMNVNIMMQQNLYSMMMPGIFFMPLLLNQVMSSLIPLFWNTFLASVIYVWGALPDALLSLLRPILPWAPNSVHIYPARRAEKGFEQPDVSLPWEYPNNNIIPSLCFLSLTVVSPFVMQMFIGYLAWSIFAYCWMRWIHLRCNRMMYYTTHRLDVKVNYSWGFPLSLLGAVWAHWAWRADVLAPYFAYWQSIFLAFFFNLVLWVIVYSCMNPNDVEMDLPEAEVRFEETQKRTLYDWFNTNPVYSLKRKFCPELVKDSKLLSTANGGRDHAVHFEMGKEYLLMNKQVCDKWLNMANHSDWMEMETYTDKILNCLEQIHIPGRGTLCCCIDASEIKSAGYHHVSSQEEDIRKVEAVP
eukprot:TRINITY_DN30111_c0_g2_i1.p1 TRINITY_DN30111_c0_g2~~TRINITY_DN30111_c0_g2_i1.p1  ORF type:complete len:1088 (-),score=144.03 TRINITY_DN30111_c0_g2_i1:125-3388(-)